MPRSPRSRLPLAALFLLIAFGCDGAQRAPSHDASPPGSLGTGPATVDDSSEAAPARDAPLEDLLSGVPELTSAALAEIRDGNDPKFLEEFFVT